MSREMLEVIFNRPLTDYINPQSEEFNLSFALEIMSIQPDWFSTEEMQAVAHIAKLNHNLQQLKNIKTGDSIILDSTMNVEKIIKSRQMKGK